ncbi:MAG: ATP-grasp domain-containing protein [Clostridia bacterium]|nr:ATP-grasp domain-containing protein [Clostridia bacterium]
MPFKNNYFSHLTKLGASIDLDNYDITHIQKSDKAPSLFPFIAKPNFGFGSINVKKILNNKELNNYKNNFNSIIKNSEVKKLQDIYFQGFKNKIIYEKDESNSDFYSVPFIFDKIHNRVIIFPILGLKKFENTEFTDFYWSSFLFYPNNIEESLQEKIRSLLHKVATTYCNTSMVCMAEVIYNREEDMLKLVEFSPRTLGGKMSQVIYMSTGINLETLFVDVMLDLKIEINTYNSVPVLLILSFENNIKSDLKFTTFSSVFDKNLYYYLYYLNNDR